MTKQIMFVGFDLSGSMGKHVSHNSATSLLDADIVVFNPDIREYIRTAVETYQGKPSLDENTSFRLTENARHWRQELLMAVNSGKTVFVMMTTSQSVFADTGQRQYSGTGRNRQTTRIVSQFDPYSAVPANLGTVVRRQGERMKSTGDLGMLSSYWRDFAKYSRYEVYLDGFEGKPRIVTQAGDMTVGAVLRPKNSRGALVLLPPLDLEAAIAEMADTLAAAAKKAGGKRRAQGNEGRLESKAETIVAKSFIGALLEIDKAAHAETEVTPPPSWVAQQDFVMAEEAAITARLAANEEQLSALRAAREELLGDLNKSVTLKALLFEKGKPLEHAILEALNLLGFKAEPYREGDSEFDAVFVAPDGRRLLGEAEGKDEKAVNIEKLDQLDRNVREDFQRPEVSEYAKGVLFGNASRLTTPEERAPFFTEKCLRGAKRSGVALVRTTDLFQAARYLKEHNDSHFAAACRSAILEANGEVVNFPPVPAAAEAQRE